MISGQLMINKNPYEVSTSQGFLSCFILFLRTLCFAVEL